MKIILHFLFSFALIIYMSGCDALVEMPETAESFFNAVKSEKYDDAYDLVSEEFKANTSKEKLIAFLQNTALTKYKSASWSSRKFENNVGELIGDIKTVDNGTIPINIKFVKEQGMWKILSIVKEAAGIENDTDGSVKNVPGEEKLKKMATDAVLDLANAINTENFNNFYEKIASIWKTQTTADNLKSNFQVFIDKQINLENVKSADIVLSETPKIANDGFLELKGYFTTQPSVVYYELTYTYEYPNWKLAGISVDVK